MADPIVIASEKDSKGKANWKDKLEPYEHQIRNLITFCKRLPVTLLADDVGLGKTISAGLILSELIVRRRVTRCLVIAPNILGPQWVEELQTKFGILAIHATGQKKLGHAASGLIPVVVTTYQSASKHIDGIDSAAFDMLILDEAHKLRNLHGGGQPPQMAERIRSALESRLFKYVLMLTATPIQNRLWDLYSLIDLLTVARGHRHPLGTPDEFKAFFVQDAAQGARQIVPGREDGFRAVLRQYLVRTRRADAKLKFPEREVLLERRQPSPAEVHLQAMIGEQFHTLNGLQQSSIARALFSSPQALARQLENSGTLPAEWNEIIADAREVADTEPMTGKLSGLIAIAKELRKKQPKDWRLVVFTIRKETQAAIARALAKEGIAFGMIQGGDPRGNQNTIERFRKASPAINVIVSTDAGAEGVNLQSGNVVVNFDLPWNPMVVEQRIGRVQRLGSNFDSVKVFNLVVRDSVEERVVARLMRKLQTIAHTVGDIEAILESTAGAKGDEQESFESQMRKMVADAFRGRDVEDAVRKEEASIEAAQKMLDEQREEIDRTLGTDLDKLDQSGPKSPKLELIRPDLPYQEFVLESYRAAGAKVEDKGDGTWVAHVPRKSSEEFTFDLDVWQERSRPGLFRAPKLLIPGRRDFEQLVQHWVDRGGHYIIDLSADGDARAERTAGQWLRKIEGGRVVNATRTKSVRHFAGSIVCKVSASNGVDGYEKLIDVDAKPDAHDGFTIDGETSDLPILAPTDPKEVHADVERQSVRAIESDPDVGEFCRFYQARLDEEITGARGDLTRQRRVESDYRPQVHGETVAVKGTRYTEDWIEIDFQIDGQGEYSAVIHAVPAANRVIDEPPFAECAATRRSVPESCLDQCSFSGLIVLRHLLVPSEASGRRALREHTDVCAVSGLTLLIDELERSVVSGRLVDRTLLVPSAVSGKRALADELVRCEVTGDCVLPDELAMSDVSKRRCRRDQIAVSAMSGLRGHRTEFVECAVTGNLIAPDESLTSELSGRIVRRDHTGRSSRPPHRLGATDELSRCDVSGKTLLADEIGECAVSGKHVDADLLVRSEVSDKMALGEHTTRCEASGIILLKNESGLSAASGKRVDKRLLVKSPVSGKLALKEEMIACELTGSLVLSDEMVVSELSGAKFRADQQVASALSGRIVHMSESVDLHDGRIAASDEAIRSDVSGLWMVSATAVTSERTGRRGLPSESVRCQVSHRVLLADEVERSSISDLLVDRELLVPSDRTGRYGLAKESVVCEETRRRLLEDEVGTCCLSHKRVDTSLLVESEISGAVALDRLMGRCASSGKRALPAELVTCEVGGETVLPTLTERCALSVRVGARRLMVKSAVSGKWLHPDLAITTAIDDSQCAMDEAVICTWTQQRILPSQSGTCVLTGLVFRHDLLNGRGELERLRQLLEQRGQRAKAPDLGGWFAESYGKGLGRIEDVVGWRSENCGAGILVGNITSALGRFVGARPRRFGCVVVNSKPIRIDGRVCIGRLNKQLRWAMESHLDA